MKKLVLLLSLLLLVVPAYSHAEDNNITASSNISAVTVYPDRALVTRKAVVALPKGASNIVFPDLPGEAQEDSLRVSGHGSAAVRIGTVESRKIYLESPARDEVKKLQDEIQGLRDEDRRLSDEQSIAGDLRKFYQSIQFHDKEIWSKEITVGKPGAEDWAKVVSFIDKGQKDAALEASNIEIKRRVLNNKIDALNKRLEDLSSTGSKQMLSVSVEVSSQGEGSLELELSYVVMGATWSPLYVAKADTDSGKVELTYQGQVTQRTSEDWKDVTLSLSTARPSVGASPPELQPWYVMLYEPVRTYSSAVGGMALDEMRRESMPMAKAKAFEANAPAPQAQAEVMTAQAEETGASVMFRAATKQDVPADGSAHKVTLSVDTFKSDFEYFTVPKLAPYAYLKGLLVNDKDYPLLPGQASVFLGEDYLGKSNLLLTAPGEKLSLALGVDEGIKVKRELVGRHEEDTGIISKTRRITFAYKITVESYKKNAQKITVQDQLPVSQQEEVVVKEIKIEPKPAEHDEHGLLTWKMDVAPKEKKEIRLEFYVEFPRDRQVGGI